MHKLKINTPMTWRNWRAEKRYNGIDRDLGYGMDLFGVRAYMQLHKRFLRPPIITIYASGAEQDEVRTVMGMAYHRATGHFLTDYELDLLNEAA